MVHLIECLRDIEGAYIDRWTMVYVIINNRSQSKDSCYARKRQTSPEKNSLASKFPRPESSWLQDMGADAGPRLPDRNNGVDELMQRLIVVRVDMKQSVINKAIAEWRSRPVACVRAKGQHFEHLLCWTWALLFRLSNCVPISNFINVVKIAKTTLCVPQIAISCFTR